MSFGIQRYLNDDRSKIAHTSNVNHYPDVNNIRFRPKIDTNRSVMPRSLAEGLLDDATRLMVPRERDLDFVEKNGLGKAPFYLEERLNVLEQIADLTLQEPAFGSDDPTIRDQMALEQALQREQSRMLFDAGKELLKRDMSNLDVSELNQLRAMTLGKFDNIKLNKNPLIVFPPNVGVRDVLQLGETSSDEEPPPLTPASSLSSVSEYPMSTETPGTPEGRERRRSRVFRPVRRAALDFS